MTTTPTELVRVYEPPTSPAGLYLRDISAVTLLTADEEVELAQLIEAGTKARRLLKHPNLPESEQASREEAVLHGNQTRHTRTDANLRLVVSVARKYRNR